VRGEQLLVRRAPGDLLDHHVDRGVFALEVAHQFLHDLALAPHGPEPDGGASVARPAAAGKREPEEQEE
jgi:hypothetical protein